MLARTRRRLSPLNRGPSIPAEPANKTSFVRLNAHERLNLLSLVQRMKQRVNPFEIRQQSVPKWVPPSNRIAMDQNVTENLNFANGWALDAAISSFNEGIQWLGYSYLSELAQRPEYRVISETIAMECTRKWIKVQAKGEEDRSHQIEELTDYMDEKRVRENYRTVTEQDGYFGRSHLYYDLGFTDDRDELRTPIGNGKDDLTIAKVKQGSLKRISTVEPIWVYPTTYDSVDPLKPDWYNPTEWFVMGKAVHASRLPRFVGREVPDILKPVYQFGGLAMSQICKPYIDNWLRTRQSVSDLIHSFSVFKLLTDLEETLSQGGEALFDRVRLFNALRDNAGLMMLNKETEDLDNVNVPLGTLDTLQAQSQEQMASISRIPLVKLLGLSPHGLNASSEGEIRVFYDHIHAFQEKFIKPELLRTFYICQLSKWGRIDPDLEFIFVPLWSMDELQTAQKREIEARTAQIHIDSAAITPEEERKRIANDPDTPYQGLEIDEQPNLQVEEQEGLVDPKLAAKGGSKGAGGGMGGGGETSAGNQKDDVAGLTHLHHPVGPSETVDEDPLPPTSSKQDPNQTIKPPRKRLPPFKRRLTTLSELMHADSEDVIRLHELLVEALNGGNADPESRHVKLGKLLGPPGGDEWAEDRHRFTKLGKMLADKDSAYDDFDSSGRLRKLARLLHRSTNFEPNHRYALLGKLLRGYDSLPPDEGTEFQEDDPYSRDLVDQHEIEGKQQGETEEVAEQSEEPPETDPDNSLATPVNEEGDGTPQEIDDQPVHWGEEEATQDAPSEQDVMGVTADPYNANIPQNPPNIEGRQQQRNAQGAEKRNSETDSSRWIYPFPEVNTDEEEDYPGHEEENAELQPGKFEPLDGDPFKDDDPDDVSDLNKYDDLFAKDAWSEEDHPRGGDPKHPGRFSKGARSKGKQTRKRLGSSEKPLATFPATGGKYGLYATNGKTKKENHDITVDRVLDNEAKIFVRYRNLVAGLIKEAEEFGTSKETITKLKRKLVESFRQTMEHLKDNPERKDEHDQVAKKLRELERDLGKVEAPAVKKPEVKKPPEPAKKKPEAKKKVEPYAKKATQPKIVSTASEEQGARIRKAFDLTPEYHRELLSDVPIHGIRQFKDVPSTAPYQGYAGLFAPEFNGPGNVYLPSHTEYKDGMGKHYESEIANQTHTALHEFAHAIDYKTGYNLGTALIPLMEKIKERMHPSTVKASKYWYQNKQEMWAEAYALTYSGGANDPYAFGMRRDVAEQLFAPVIEKVKQMEGQIKHLLKPEWKQKYG